jgi:mitochondrial import inner membrane translocase subunit TIM50
MPNVPHDIPIPHTLVLDLEKTLVSSSWDRKYGWRHAKRPGVDKFLHDMAQYYEIVLYTPSIDGIAEPVVNNLDKDGCIMHRLYRDATYYYHGVHVKDLHRLNRNINKIVVLDDDPLEVQFNLENLIRVKPYTDPKNRTDNTLERITPFLMEIVREGHDNVPALLAQYRGMDADEIADEQERRIQVLRDHRQQMYQQRQQAISKIFGTNATATTTTTTTTTTSGGSSLLQLPEPELPPSPDAYSLSYRTTSSSTASSSSNKSSQLTAKDIVNASSASSSSSFSSSDGMYSYDSNNNNDDLSSWIQRRNKEKQEHQARKMEKWNEVMMKKQQEAASAAVK